MQARIGPIRSTTRIVAQASLRCTCHAAGVSNNTTEYRGTDALVSSLSSKVQLHKPNVIDLILYGDETDRFRSHAHNPVRGRREILSVLLYLFFLVPVTPRQLNVILHRIAGDLVRWLEIT